MNYSAVLFSGGLDSAVLLADAAQQAPVRPLYVSVGFAWEAEERAAAARLLAGLTAPHEIAPLVELRFDMTDIFPASHWAVRGEPPAYDTPDEDVYLDGRNVILLAKAAVFMARKGMSTVYLGPLKGNPFPDATPIFFSQMATALSSGLAHEIRVETPFVRLSKSEVIKKGVTLGVPLGLTLSCMRPRQGLACGQCSKCRERIDAFRDAGIQDPARPRPYR